MYIQVVQLTFRYGAICQYFSSSLRAASKISYCTKFVGVRKTYRTPALRDVRCSLSPLGSFVALHHEGSLFVGPVLVLPVLALHAELVHLARTDGPELLSAGKAHHPQGVKVQRSDAVVVLRDVLFHGQGRDEFESHLLLSGRDAGYDRELARVRVQVGVVGQDGLAADSVGDETVDANGREGLGRGFFEGRSDGYAETPHPLTRRQKRRKDGRVPKCGVRRKRYDILLWF
mmetsp:Transcript_8930/g.19660  ORF Transcript_8930/g.19660 Transcript_8930/m.19660 type:complete len:231 (-) Transcript_8930:420-1112(-)